MEAKSAGELVKLPHFRVSSNEIAAVGDAAGSMRASASDSEITETQFIHGLGVEQVTPVEDNRGVHALSDL
jgi:hypothetical protein